MLDEVVWYIGADVRFCATAHLGADGDNGLRLCAASEWRLLVHRIPQVHAVMVVQIVVSMATRIAGT